MANGTSRPRNAAQTREDILQAAQKLFSQRGYEHIGVRDIAAEVGINGSLVIRYFGSKEQLFAESVTEAFRLGDLLQGHREGLGERLVRYLLQEDSEATFYPILALLKSATSPQGATLLREGLETHFIQPLAEWLGGGDSSLRATLIASTLLGVAVMQDVLYITPLTTSSTDSLVAYVAPVIQRYIDDASW
jgi:AcrR family transcriptional regulator